MLERYDDPAAWKVLEQQDHRDLATEVADLPSDVEADEEEAKRFDLLMLNLQAAGQVMLAVEF